MKTQRKCTLNQRRVLLAGCLLAFFVIIGAIGTHTAQATTIFFNSGQSLGNSSGVGVALGDLDGDGDLDAFVATYYDHADEVWFNDGKGNFTNSGQVIDPSNWYSNSVVLADFDKDGDLDAFVLHNGGLPSKVFWNDGKGNFTDSGQNLYNPDSFGVALGDLDGDGDLDVFIASAWGLPAKVWINVGSGQFVDSGQSLDNPHGIDVVLADVDGDGDLDAIVANGSGQNKLWLNNGSAQFTDSGQLLSSDAPGVAIGDLDRDGDLDAFFANTGPNEVWFNDGKGKFTNSGQALGSLAARRVILGDVDKDSDLDALVFTIQDSVELWLNNGKGNFVNSGEKISTPISHAGALGDLDKDGDLDAFILRHDGQPDEVWFNQLMLSQGSFSRTLSSCYIPGTKLTVTLNATPSSSTNTYAVEETPPAGWTVSNISDGGVYESSTNKVKFGAFFDNQSRALKYDLTPSAGTGNQTFAGKVSVNGVSQDITGQTVIAACQLYHPADINQDFRIVMDELTAYGSAWKSGATWSVAPNPIPVDYAIRAASLWKSGEKYKIDFAAGTYPLCWVNDPTRSERSDTRDSASSAVRQMSQSYQAGQAFTVSVLVTPASTVTAYGIEDLLPSGWTASGMDNGGSYDEVNNRVKFGPFVDNQARTLTYQVTPPADAKGTYSISGAASFDGNKQPVTGSGLIKDTVDPGDVNGDGKIDLADAVLALKVVAGLNPKNVFVKADVNGDGKIGIEEVIFILQKVAGLR